MCRHRRRQQEEHSRIEGQETPLIDMLATGQNILKLRRKAGLSVKDVQVRMELASTQAIYRWQRGETLPSIDNLIILADVLGVSIDEIIVRKHGSY